MKLSNLMFDQCMDMSQSEPKVSDPGSIHGPGNRLGTIVRK